MSLENSVSCEACNSSNVNKYRDHLFTAGNTEYKLVCCSDCGLINTSPLPEVSFLNDFYQRSFSYEWYSEHLAEKTVDAKARAKELVPFLGRSVLDFGGGYGYFSKSCKELGLSSEVFDPYAPGDHKKVAEGQKWDSVVSIHSLEHARLPLETLESIKSMLNRDGKLIIVVPNSSSQAYKKYGMASVWAQPPFLHLYHFNLESLATILKRSGFDVVSHYTSDRWDANYLCDVALRGMFCRIDGMWSKIENKKVRKFYSKVSGFLRRLFFHAGNVVLPKYLRNEELTIVAKLVS